MHFLVICSWDGLLFTGRMVLHGTDYGGWCLAVSLCHWCWYGNGAADDATMPDIVSMLMLLTVTILMQSLFLFEKVLNQIMKFQMDLMIGKNFCTMMPYKLCWFLSPPPPRWQMVCISSSWNMVLSGIDAEGCTHSDNGTRTWLIISVQEWRRQLWVAWVLLIM